VTHYSQIYFFYYFYEFTGEREAKIMLKFGFISVFDVLNTCSSIYLQP